jgi:hypothetical protein
MSDSSLQAAFREKLLHLLRTEFRGLSEQELYSAFATVVQDLRTNVGTQTPPKGKTPVAVTADPNETVVLPSPDLDNPEIVSDSWDLDFESDQPSLDRSFEPSLAESSHSLSGDEPSTEHAASDAAPAHSPQQPAHEHAADAAGEPELPPAPESGGSPPPDSRDGLSKKTYLVETSSGWSLAFDVFTAQALDELSEQLSGTAGLFVQLDQEVELNAAVDVCLILPVTGEEVWWAGRVVFQSPAGTAIDVRPATPEWRSILESAHMVFGATSIVPRSPSGGPTTAPPRLRRATSARVPRPSGAAPEVQPPENRVEAPPPPATPLPRNELHGADAPSSYAPSAGGPGSIAPHSYAPATTPRQPPGGYAQPPPAGQYPPQPGGFPQQPHWDPASFPPASPWAQAPTGQVTAPAPGPLDTKSIRSAMRAAAPSVSGPINDERPLSLYVTDIASRQEDGLAVIRGAQTYYLIMQVGCPVDIRMEPRNPDLHLGSLLVNAGALTWEAHKEAERFSIEKGVSYDTALVQLRHIPYQQSLAALQSRMVFVLGHIFQEVDGGEFEYYDLGPLPQRYGTPPVSIGQIAFKYVFEGWKERNTKELESHLEPYEQFTVHKVVPPPIPLAEIQLSKKHKRFWEVVLAADNKVRNVPSISNLGHAATLGLLLTLRDLGFLRFEEGEHVDGQEARARVRLNVMHDKIAGGTYYELLSLHWSAYTELVQSAYDSHKKEFETENWADAIVADSQHKIEEIQVAVDKAYEVLKDKKSRAEYRETVVNSMQLLNGVALYFRKGDMAMLRRDAREALSSFQRVLELDPRHKGARQKLKMIRDAERKAKE